MVVLSCSPPRFIPCVNLEECGCPKFDKLMQRGFLKVLWCSNGIDMLKEVISLPALAFKFEMSFLKEQGQHLRILSVFGFNTGSYDLNVLKQYIIPPLLEDGIEMCIKRNQTYMSLQTERLRFLDICNFLAAGSSYAGFLKAYGCEESKGFFPYEWISVEKLDHPSLPPHQAFYSKLRGENITEEDYHHCQVVSPVMYPDTKHRNVSL